MSRKRASNRVRANPSCRTSDCRRVPMVLTGSQIRKRGRKPFGAKNVCGVPLWHSWIRMFGEVPVG